MLVFGCSGLVFPQSRLPCPPANRSRIQTALPPGSPAPAGAVVQSACPFCEDRGPLPAESFKRAFERRDPNTPNPVGLNFSRIPRAIDEANPGLNTPAYNGGLFATIPD